MRLYFIMALFLNDPTPDEAQANSLNQFCFFYDPSAEAQDNCLNDVSGAAHSKIPREKRKRQPSSPKEHLKRRPGSILSKDLLSNSLDTTRVNDNGWSRFLVLESENPEESLSRLSPFAMPDNFKAIHSSITNVKMIKAGVYLFECPDAKVSNIALNWNGQTIFDRKIKVTPHRTLNTCRGVIRSQELEKEPNPEEKLKPQNITGVHRVSRKKGETTVQTQTYFLTFCTPNPPEYVDVGYERCKVSLFVQRPMQCYNCQRFGHTKQKCKSNPVCGRCGHESHDGPCTEEAVCPNCKGAHAPSSKNCPSYKKEAAIQKLRSEKKMSFTEAKKVVEQSVPLTSLGKSYAECASQQAPERTQAPRNPPRSCGVQVSEVGVLSEAIRAEALASGRAFKEHIKSKRNRKEKETSAQTTAENRPQTNNKKQQANRSAERGRRQAQAPNSESGGATRPAPKPAQPSSQPKKGGPPAPAPQAAGEEQAKEPAPVPPPPGRSSKPTPSSRSQSGGSSRSQSGGRKKPAREPAPTSPKAKPGESPAPAPKAAGEEQVEEPIPVQAPPDIRMEEPSASAHQAAEGGEIGTPATTPVKEGAGTPQPGSVLSSPALTFAEKRDRFGQADFNFSMPKDFGFSMSKKKGKPWNRSKGKTDAPNRGDEVSTLNRFNPFMDPEEMDQ